MLDSAQGAGLTLGDDEFATLQALIRDEAGIALGDGKRQLLVARLGRRLRAHGLTSFAEYCRLLEGSDPQGVERRELVNSITTNTTSFFREGHHFERLRAELFAPLLEGGVPVNIWSAACSTGEEAFSLAMTAASVLGARAPELVRILGTDIDTRALAVAERGVYPVERFEHVSPATWKPWVLRGRDASEGLVRIKPEVRRMVSFRQLNLAHDASDLGLFHAVLCRNVIIYFEPQTTARLIERLAQVLRPGGLLMLGHSESLAGIQGPFDAQGHTVYRRHDEPSGKPAAARRWDRSIGAGEVFASAAPATVRTLLGSCVAACLYDPVARVGGLNHFALADAPRDAAGSTRYGVHAMELLINEVMQRGGDRRRLRAKVFGACNALGLESGQGAVAAENARFVREFLVTERIPLVAERLGDDAGLELLFETASGRARVRSLDARRAAGAALEEERYRTRLADGSAVPCGETTLFEVDE